MTYGERDADVDIVRNMYDLDGFPPNSVAAVYSRFELLIGIECCADKVLYYVVTHWNIQL